MFPIHEDTIFLLALVGVGGCMALFTAMRRPLRRRSMAAALLLGLLWPWPVAFFLGLDSYTVAAAFFLGAGTLAALVVGTAWGLITRRLTVGIAAPLVALFPAIVGSAVMLERQRVPYAPCAERAMLQIGDLALTVPRDLGFRSVAANGAPEQAWQGSYADWTGAKADVRALCRATDGGREPVKVSQIWMSFGAFRRDHAPSCDTGQVPDDLGGYCAALARTELTVVQLYARPDGRPLPSLSHFNEERVTRALSAGERDGYYCNDSTGGSEARYCTIWQKLTPEILAVSSAKLGAAVAGEDPVSDAAVLLEALISGLGTE